MLRDAVLVAAATVFMSGASLGQQGQDTWRMQERAGQGVRQRVVQLRERGMERLNLTDEQKKQMQKLQLDLEKKNTPIQSQIKLARLDIREQMMADKPDKARIEKSMKQVSDLQLQVKMNGLDHMFSVRGILTPEQLKNWHGMGPGGQQMQRRLRVFRQGLDSPVEDFGEGPDEDIVIERD